MHRDYLDRTSVGRKILNIEIKLILFALYVGLLVLFVVFVIGIIFSNRQPEIEYSFPAPEEVVRQYFTAWNDKGYPNMYATFSDGFKNIEPTAKDLRAFKEYVQTQPIDGVNIKTIDEKSNDGRTASVDYAVEFLLKDGTKQPFEGTFTLKYREGDIIRGWKLIHPYGENIDTS